MDGWMDGFSHRKNMGPCYIRAFTVFVSVWFVYQISQSPTVLVGQFVAEINASLLVSDEPDKWSMCCSAAS
jgi:hypothetical protein